VDNRVGGFVEDLLGFLETKPSRKPPDNRTMLEPKDLELGASLGIISVSGNLCVMAIVDVVDVVQNILDANLRSSRRDRKREY
jgi:hypothetical protein